jgi:hypothetical protein
MAEIQGYAIEKQDGPELCWAAAVKSVLDYYLPAKVSPTQQQLWTRFGKAKDGQRVQANDTAQVLRSVGALHSVDVYNADPGEKFRYTTLGLKISDHIRKQQPVVCSIQGIGKSNSFVHAVVIWKVLEMPLPKLYLKDPARPAADLDVVLDVLLRGEWNYVSFSQYDQLNVYARTFMFTEKPNSYALASAGLIEKNVS